MALPALGLAESRRQRRLSVMSGPAVVGRYINLDRSEARRREVEGEVAKLGAVGAYARFAAVEGALSAVRPDVRNRAVLGCYLSHLAVIQAHAGSDAWLHVVEDDVLVSRHAATAIRSICRAPEFADYDLVFTNVRLPDDAEIIGGCRNLFDRSVEVTPEGEVVAIRQVTAAPLAEVDFLQTTSYLVNPRAAGRVAALVAAHLGDAPLPPIDRLYSRLSRAGDLAVACTIPFFTMPRLDADSTVNRDAPWALGHRIKGAALYADRDVAALRARLKALSGAGPLSATDELMADAYRYLIRVEPG
jgi:GR25 family glycosyltransferase involved in LPS biosynthesis